MSALLEPIRIGDLDLPNRVIMAPLTRCRADDDRAPNPLMATYYQQRASMGLIIAEATSIDPMGVGYPNTPGVWTAAQIDGWKEVTRAVHGVGGRIFLQLWHVGRMSDPYYLNGQLPIAPSAIAPAGHVSLLRPVRQHSVPRAIETREIASLVEQYKQAAVHAKAAGFDGVEIHAGNGYLIDQFLQSSTNRRSDEYGGSAANRARFLLEVTDACIEVWGPQRIGVHFSPRGDLSSMGDANSVETFGHAIKELDKRHIAFLFVREHLGADSIGPILKDLFNGTYIANEGFTPETGDRAIRSGIADAVGFGVMAIANPDLAERISADGPYNRPNPATFYGGGAQGYTDYPTLSQLAGYR